MDISSVIHSVQLREGRKSLWLSIRFDWKLITLLARSNSIYQKLACHSCHMAIALWSNVIVCPSNSSRPGSLYVCLDGRTSSHLFSAAHINWKDRKKAFTIKIPRMYPSIHMILFVCTHPTIFSRPN